jgi:hypothetical protein
MNKPVATFTIVFALAISFGLIAAAVAGVDIPRLGRAFFGLVVLLLAGGVVAGFISSFLRP